MHTILRWICVAALIGAVWETAFRAAAQEANAQPRKPAPGAADDAQASVELFLQNLCDAFGRKDEAAVRAAFGANFAGPFRVPKIAQSMLARFMKVAEGIAAEVNPVDVFVVGDCAVCTADCALSLTFPGGREQRFEAPLLLRLDRSGREWKITDAVRLAEDWAPEPEDGRIVWKDLGVSFPEPGGDWILCPVQRPDVVRSVDMISPDLRVTITVAAGEPPAVVRPQVAAEGMRVVEQLFPGSKVLNVKSVRLAGRPGTEVRMDMNLGPRVYHTAVRIVEHSDALVFAGVSVASPEPLATGIGPFERVCRGLQFSPIPKRPPDPATGQIRGGRYVNDKFGVTFEVPSGWTAVPFSSAGARRRGWDFGVCIRPESGDGFLILGRRRLPGPVPPAMLKRFVLGGMQMAGADARIVEDKDIQVAGRPAASLVVRVRIGRNQMHRDVLIAAGRGLVFLHAEGRPGDEWKQIVRCTDEILKSLELREIDAAQPGDPRR